MPRKPRKHEETAEEIEVVEGDDNNSRRLSRLEAQLEDLNLASQVQARDIQTIRARLEQIKLDLEEIGEGASPEDLARVEEQVAQVRSAVEEVRAAVEGLRQDHEAARARLESLQAGGPLLEELNRRLEESAQSLKGGLSSLEELQWSLDERLRKLEAGGDVLETVRSEVQSHTETLAQNLQAEVSERAALLEERVSGLAQRVERSIEEFHENLRGSQAELASGLEAVRQEVSAAAAGERVEELSRALEGLRQRVVGPERIEELTQALEALRASAAPQGRLEELDAALQALKEDLAARPTAGDLAELRQSLADLSAAMADASALGQRARESLESVGQLEARIREAEERFASLSSRIEEVAGNAQLHLDRMNLALKLVEQIEEKARSFPPAALAAAPVAAAPAAAAPVVEVSEAELDNPAPTGGDLGFELDDLLQVMIKHSASDLHLKVGTPPTVRLDGELIPVGNQSLSEADCRYLVFAGMSRAQRRTLLTKKELDFAYSIPGARFRVNAFMERGFVSAAFRMLRTEVPSIEELGLPTALKKLASLNNGLILVTGPAGSGKSTTLAAMIDYINSNRKMHIITIEDPIEFYHKDKLSIVTQREVGSDTSSFSEALKQALRQDPNVVMVGEMRDPETIMTAVIAAETGHLVLSTMHTPNTVGAIDRIIDAFSGETQRQFRLLLANNLRAVISQRLLVRADEKGRVPAVEVLISTPTISSLVLEGKTQEIYPYIQQGSSEGMQTFTQSLMRLYEAGLITKEEALYHADQPTEFRLGVEGHVTGTAVPTVTEDTLMNWL
ncbi:MAG TPA: PilT/PilU family type 4a pilus ATPase [Candidatus Nitrosotenuis sp.]|nr:PilT/PilU family type 4a pilus ATPase [Candidatus Nitrosotenuis sp.]